MTVFPNTRIDRPQTVRAMTRIRGSRSILCTPYRSTGRDSLQMPFSRRLTTTILRAKLSAAPNQRGGAMETFP